MGGFLRLHIEARLGLGGNLRKLRGERSCHGCRMGGPRARVGGELRLGDALPRMLGQKFELEADVGNFLLEQPSGLIDKCYRSSSGAGCRTSAVGCHSCDGRTPTAQLCLSAFPKKYLIISSPIHILRYRDRPSSLFFLLGKQGTAQTNMAVSNTPPFGCATHPLIMLT